MQILKFIFFINLSVSLCSCNSYDDTSKTSQIVNLPSDTIFSIYYETDSEEVQLFREHELKCTASHLIDAASGMPEVNLNFVSLSKTENQIEDINVEMKWNRNGKIIMNPFNSSNINLTVFCNDNLKSTYSFASFGDIEDTLRRVSGVNNTLMYNIKYSDEEYTNIPSDVESIIMIYQIKILSYGKIYHYKKEVILNSAVHKIVIPHDSRND